MLNPPRGWARYTLAKVGQTVSVFIRSSSSEAPFVFAGTIVKHLGANEFEVLLMGTNHPRYCVAKQLSNTRFESTSCLQ
jgi:hypothetical protein